jgi:hypothetical protein
MSPYWSRSKNSSATQSIYAIGFINTVKEINRTSSDPEAFLAKPAAVDAGQAVDVS